MKRKELEQKSLFSDFPIKFSGAYLSSSTNRSHLISLKKFSSKHADGGRLIAPQMWQFKAYKNQAKWFLSRRICGATQS